MTANDIELAVSRNYGIRQNIIVPNVSWGIHCLQYEADLVVLRPSGWGIEIEIKVSGSDIKADLKKRHTHDCNLFKELWFAVPEELAGHSDIPERAGIISVKVCVANSYQPNGHSATRIRPATTNKEAIKWSDRNRQALCRLATMRVWSLKATIAKIRKIPTISDKQGDQG